MTWSIHPYGLLQFVAGGIALAVVHAAWSRRRVRGAGWFVLMMVGAAVWCLDGGLEMIVAQSSTKFFFSRIGFIGACTIGTSWFLFAVRYSGQDGWLTRTRVAALWIFPWLVIVGAMTSEWHNLVWVDVTMVPTRLGYQLGYVYGILVWMIGIYSWLLVGVGCFFLMRSSRDVGPFYRRQTVMLLLGICFPTITTILYLANLMPYGWDPTPIAFAFTGMLSLWGFFRLRFLDLQPIAHDHVFMSMRDGVVVLDNQERIVDVNPAAARLVGFGRSKVGNKVEVALGVWRKLVFSAPVDERSTAEVVFEEGGMKRWLEVSRCPVFGNRGRQYGWLLMLRDVSERKLLEEELRRHAMTDPLTGAFNRRMGTVLLDRQLALSYRERSDLTVCFFDVDDLKEVNDRFGHQEGDVLLREVAEVVRSTIRESDSLCRLGGDEFLIIFPNCRQEVAASIWKRIELSFEEHSRGRPWRLGASHGFASAERERRSSAGVLIAEADQAMYQEKRRRRSALGLRPTPPVGLPRVGE